MRIIECLFFCFLVTNLEKQGGRLLVDLLKYYACFISLLQQLQDLVDILFMLGVENEMFEWLANNLSKVGRFLLVSPPKYRVFTWTLSCLPRTGWRPVSGSWREIGFGTSVISLTTCLFVCPPSHPAVG